MEGSASVKSKISWYPQRPPMGAGEGLLSVAPRNATTQHQSRSDSAPFPTKPLEMATDKYKD